jgi:uncharacterized protein YukE
MRMPAVRVMLKVYVQIGGAEESRPTTGKEVEMEKAAKEVAPEITPTEEIMGTTEEIVAEAKDEVKEAPSRIRKKLRQLAAAWEDASVRSSASGSDVVGSSLAGMYGAKFQALAKEHEQVRPDKR